MAIKVWSAGETLTAADLNSNFSQKQNTIVDTGWTNTGLVWSANWEDYQPTTSAGNHFEYRKFGPVIKFRGLVRRVNSDISSATETILTLPASLIPTRTEIFELMTSGAWVTGAQSAGTAHTHNVFSSTVSGPVLRTTFNSSGTVQVVIPAQVNIVVGNWITFAPVVYFAD